jgi:hypothetical protein
MSLRGYLGPWMSTDIIMNFHFMHNHGGRLSIHRVTGQVLWLVLWSPKGFIPSVLKANLRFLASSANSKNSLSIALYWDPSVGCLNMLSTLRSSLFHCNSFAWSLFLNRRFRRGIIGAYHITLAGIFFLGHSLPSTSPGSSRLILYHNSFYTGHSSKFL